MKHLIVIPAYNEAENIELIINKIFELYAESSLLIVDDSSPDGTIEIVNKLKKRYDKLYTLSQPCKTGLAKAYINGFKWGIQNGFDLFTTCDADFSHNPKYIKNAIEFINQGYDAACGSRYITGGSTQESNLFKNFISRAGNIYAASILGGSVKDWTEGFNTYTLYALEKINLDKIKAKGYIFHAEMKYGAKKNGCKLVEFPIDFAERTRGKSKMSLSIILEGLFSVIRVKLSA